MIVPTDSTSVSVSPGNDLIPEKESQDKSVSENLPRADWLLNEVSKLPAFKTPQGDIFVTLPVGLHVPVRSQAFRDFLTTAYAKKWRRLPTEGAFDLLPRNSFVVRLSPF